MVLINLVLDMIGRIAQENGRSIVTGRHFGARTLQSVEKAHVNECRLGIFEASGAVSCQTEVRVLVNGTRNQAGNAGSALLVFAKDVRKRRGKGCSTLDTGKVNFANV